MLYNFFNHPIVKIFFTVLFSFGIFFISLILFLSALIRIINDDTPLITEPNSIGVIEVTGIINDSKDALETLSKYSEDENIKAIIFKINSPGGGVVPSQEIYSEILKVKEKKRVYAYFQSLAASGGYYIGCACNKIIANPGTVTGSIGVIIEFTNFEKLFNKIGIDAVFIKSGKFKDTGNPFRPMTEDEKLWISEVVQNIYNQFLNAVSVNRNIPIDSLKEIADGRIFTGEQALKYNLIDKIGNFNDLISIIKAELNLPDKPKIIYIEKKRDLIGKLFENSEKVFLKFLENKLLSINYNLN